MFGESCGVVLLLVFGKGMGWWLTREYVKKENGSQATRAVLFAMRDYLVTIILRVAVKSPAWMV